MKLISMQNNYRRYPLIRHPLIRRFWQNPDFFSKMQKFSEMNGVHNCEPRSQNCERRSQHRENFIEFYASFRSLTISFLLQKHPSQPRSLLPPIERSACILKNSFSQIVNVAATRPGNNQPIFEAICQ